MSHERLVQYPNLENVVKVGNPELLPEDMLSASWNAARSLCQDHSFAAIAFNQIPENILSNIGFTSNPSIIYVHDSPFKNLSDYHGYLLVNPEIKIEGAREFVMIEGCGSIVAENGKSPIMAILRPDFVAGYAHFWSPNMDAIQRKNYFLSFEDAGILDHEMHHLEGYSALSFPDLMLDIRKKSVMNMILRRYSYENQLMIMKDLKEKGGIVYDSISGKIIQINLNYEMVREIIDVQNTNEIKFPTTRRNSQIIRL